MIFIIMNADSSQFVSCSVCNERFTVKKHFVIHCYSILHRERSLLFQASEKSWGLTLDTSAPQQALTFDSAANEWFLIDTVNSCKPLVLQDPANLRVKDSLYETVFRVINKSWISFHDSKHSDDGWIINHAIKSSELKSCDAKVKSEDNMGVLAHCRTDSPVLLHNSDIRAQDGSVSSLSEGPVKTLLNSSYSKSLNSIISSDPLKFDFEKMTSCDEKMMHTALGIFKTSCEELNSHRLHVPTVEGKHTFITGEDPRNDLSEDQTHFCRVCDILDSAGLNAHSATRDHCKMLLVRQLELGLEKFHQFFGDVPFSIFIPGIEPPPCSFDAHFTRIYRCGVFNNMRCKACDTQTESMKAWYEHSLSPLHTTKMFLLLDTLDNGEFLAKYGDLPLPRNVCLSQSD